MEKKYTTPEINVVSFDTEDIILTSGTSLLPKTTVGDYNGSEVQVLPQTNVSIFDEATE